MPPIQVKICRVVQKFGTIILYALTLTNINRPTHANGVLITHHFGGPGRAIGVCLCVSDFQTCFTTRIRRKFAIILSLKIRPHL